MTPDRAPSRRHLVLGFLLLGLIAGVAFATVWPVTTDNTPSEDDAELNNAERDDTELKETELNGQLLESLVVELINEQRKQENLPPVEIADDLAAVARNHSQDMIERDYYAHETPEGVGPAARVERRDSDCEIVGENIAATWWLEPFEHEERTVRHTSERSVATGIRDQWLGSLSHRNNLLDPRWERTGVGVAKSDENRLLVTQLFCR